MKRLLAAICALTAGLILTSARAQAAEAQTHVIDVTKPKTAPLALKTGDRVVFVRPVKWSGADHTVRYEYEAGSRLRTRCPLRIEATDTMVRKGYVSLSSFRVIGANTGSFIITAKENSSSARGEETTVPFTSEVNRRVDDEDIDCKPVMRRALGGSS